MKKIDLDNPINIVESDLEISKIHFYLNNLYYKIIDKLSNFDQLDLINRKKAANDELDKLVTEINILNVDIEKNINLIKSLEEKLKKHQIINCTLIIISLFLIFITLMNPHIIPYVICISIILYLIYLKLGEKIKLFNTLSSIKKLIAKINHKMEDINILTNEKNKLTKKSDILSTIIENAQIELNNIESLEFKLGLTKKYMKILNETIILNVNIHDY